MRNDFNKALLTWTSSLRFHHQPLQLILVLLKMCCIICIFTYIHLLFCGSTTLNNSPRSVTRVYKGSTVPWAPNHYGGSEWLRGAPKNPHDVTSSFFNTVHLLSKDLRCEHGAPNVLRPPS